MPHLSLPRLPTIFQRHIYWKSMGCAKQADYLSDQIILRSLPGLLVLPPLSDRRDSTPIFCLRSQKQRGIMSPGHHRNRKHSFSRKCQQGDIFARGLGGGRKGPLLERERLGCKWVTCFFFSSSEIRKKKKHKSPGSVLTERTAPTPALFPCVFTITLSASPVTWALAAAHDSHTRRADYSTLCLGARQSASSGQRE